MDFPSKSTIATICGSNPPTFYKELVKINRVKSAKIITHGGVFHADDVLSTALVLLCSRVDLVDTSIQRRRDVNNMAARQELEHMSKGVYYWVLDTNGEDRTEQIKNSSWLVCLDHHQDEAKYYESGVKYATCGKLFDYLIDNKIIEIHKSIKDEFIDRFRKYILWPVEYRDNGQGNDSSCTVDFKDVNSNMLQWIRYMNPVGVGQNEYSKYDSAFMQCVAMIIVQLEGFINKIIADSLSMLETKSIVHDSLNLFGHEIVYMENYIPYNQSIIAENKYRSNPENKDTRQQIVGTIYRNSDGTGYVLKLVDKEHINMEAPNAYYCIFEDYWIGTRGSAAQLNSGIKDLTFVSSDGRMCVSDTLDGCFKAVSKLRKICSIKIDQNIATPPTSETSMHQDTNPPTTMDPEEADAIRRFLALKKDK